jgi:hypothetical protein
MVLLKASALALRVEQLQTIQSFATRVVVIAKRPQSAKATPGLQFPQLRRWVDIVEVD